jgi:glucosylceramidase
LNDYGGPKIENTGPSPLGCGCKDCRGAITINSLDTATWNPEVEYFLIGHFSKFLQPGADVRVKSNPWEDDLETVAFQNTDGSVVLIVADGLWGTEKSFALNFNGENYVVRDLPSEGAVTLILQ